MNSFTNSGRILVVLMILISYLFSKSGVVTHNYYSIFFVCLYSVSNRIYDLTQDHGLNNKLIKTISFVCVIVLTVEIWILEPTYMMSKIAFHIIKGKVDTIQHLIAIFICCYIFILLSFIISLEIDITYVIISAVWSMVWATLNNRILNMGDTVANQFGFDFFICVGLLTVYDYDRFHILACIAVTEKITYATTKLIFLTAPYYVKSKRELLPRKNEIMISLFDVMGELLWTTTYTLMIYSNLNNRRGDFPVEIFSFFIILEVIEVLGKFDASRLKRIFGVFYSLGDLSLHVIFIFFESSNRRDLFGIFIPSTIVGRLIYVCVYIAFYVLVISISFSYNIQCRIKYIAWPMYMLAALALIRNPVVNMKAYWISMLANSCFAVKIFSDEFSKSRMVLAPFIVGLPITQILAEIFRNIILGWSIQYVAFGSLIFLISFFLLF